jgi:tetratricopeptide (TPR) repeat protein
LQTALPFARRSTGAQDKAFELRPDNSRLKRNTAAGRVNEGKIYRDLGETEQALHLENQAKEIILAIAANDPENHEINLDLKEVFEDLAFTHIKRGDFAEAEKNFQISVDYCERLLKKDPENYEFWVARLKGESEYANALIEIGKPQLAKPIYLRAAAKAEKDLPKKFTEFNEKFKQEIRDGLAKCI